MAKWTFEPGHTAAEFSVRHMMVTYVRGHFKNVKGTLEFDPKNPGNILVKVTIDANKIWSGDTERDNHLRADDFWRWSSILTLLSLAPDKKLLVITTTRSPEI